MHMHDMKYGGMCEFIVCVCVWQRQYPFPLGWCRTSLVWWVYWHSSVGQRQTQV